MARGNQRDEARAKNLKKDAGASKKEGNPQTRNLNDSTALIAKVKAKEEAAVKAAQVAEYDKLRQNASTATPTVGVAGSVGGISVPVKKIVKKVDTGLDLLDAGLNKGKKK